jgi:hypothetical protein
MGKIEDVIRKKNELSMKKGELGRIARRLAYAEQEKPNSYKVKILRRDLEKLKTEIEHVKEILEREDYQ